MRKLFIAATAALALLLSAMPGAGAITDGELDGEDHPYVGMIAIYEGEPGQEEYVGRCSGSLISPTLMVTAGHCTFGASVVDLYFDTDNTDTPPALVLGEGDVTGTPYTHPLYVPEAFFLYDLGVVVLDEPVILDEYAVLPEAGVVDTLDKGRKNAEVTIVGYGLQEIISNPQKGPVKLQADRVRYQADVFIVNSQGVAGIGQADIPVGPNSLFLSGDAANGGGCFGDSGGPSLIEDNVLIAVTSFGLNGNCAGVGGVFRIDRDVELDWINSFA